MTGLARLAAVVARWLWRALGWIAAAVFTASSLWIAYCYIADERDMRAMKRRVAEIVGSAEDQARDVERWRAAVQERIALEDIIDGKPRGKA
jgi:hypothetical protein